MMKPCNHLSPPRDVKVQWHNSIKQTPQKEINACFFFFYFSSISVRLTFPALTKSSLNRNKKEKKKPFWFDKDAISTNSNPFPHPLPTYFDFFFLMPYSIFETYNEYKKMFLFLIRRDVQNPTGRENKVCLSKAMDR